MSLSSLFTNHNFCKPITDYITFFFLFFLYFNMKTIRIRLCMYVIDWRLTITCCAAVKIAGSNAENAAAAAADELNCNCGSLGTFTYGATRHGSRGVDTFWCNIKPVNVFYNKIILLENIFSKQFTPNTHQIPTK